MDFKDGTENTPFWRNSQILGAHRGVLCASDTLTEQPGEHMQSLGQEALPTEAAQR